MINKVLKISFCVFLLSNLFCEANENEPNETNPKISPSPLSEVIKPGDKLFIIFHHDRTIALERIVDEDGIIDLNQIGKVKVGGKTKSEAESIIQSAYLNKNIYKELTVEIKVNQNWETRRLRTIQHWTDGEIDRWEGVTEEKFPSY